jgi:hypothetical protein
VSESERSEEEGREVPRPRTLAEIGDESRKAIRPRTLAWIVAGAVAIATSAIKAGGWEALAELLTLTYQLGWITLACHHLQHVFDGYFQVGLARPTAYEFALVVAWGAAAVVLGNSPDPNLWALTACWLLSAAWLFHSAALMEQAREQLKLSTGYRARRTTDAIRSSETWFALCNLFARVDDETVDEFRRKLSQPDTKDGNLSRTIWVACCSTVAIGLIAAGGALGSVLAPPEEGSADRDGGSERREEKQEAGGGNESGGGTDATDAEAKEEDCGEDWDPVNVPQPARNALILAWREVDDLEPGPMEALGFDIAGCPGLARPIPGLPGSWYALGWCEGSLRAAAIVLRGATHPVALLEQAAEFALPLIRDGRFRSAEDRFEVGDGDAYVIHTRDGSFVPIRDDVTAGPVGEGDEGGGCGSYGNRDVAYSFAGAGLIGVWKAVATITPGGVYPIAYGTASDGEVRFALRSPGVGIVTVAHCTPSLLTCEAKVAGINRRWSGETIERAEVEALVEP